MDFLIQILCFLCFSVCCSALNPYAHMYLAYKGDILKNAETLKKNVLLTSNEDIKSKVVLIYYSKRVGYGGQVIKPGDTKKLKGVHFNPSKPTKILIHGWMDSADGAMIDTLKNAFFASDEDVNLLAVDWSAIAMGINYIGIAMKTSDVGAYVATVVDFLVSEGCRLSDIHLIGHSLGAHIAGKAAVSIKEGKVHRVTGLDPALPGFGWTPRLGRTISASDAEFVDCVHTCGGLLGISEPICQVDFYPNGGGNPQPGCPSLFDAGKCSHFRSFRFFAESILKSHKFPTMACTSVKDLDRNCTSTSVQFGYYTNQSSRGLFEVYTNSKFPFAPVLLH